MDIVISSDVIKKCVDFTEMVVPNQSNSMFREYDVTRDYEKMYSDTLRGKIGEEAFALFLKDQYGLDVELDYSIYKDKSKGDQQDIELFKRRIEIKTTKKHSKNLLVDCKDIRNKNNIDKLPHIYVLVLLTLERTHGNAKIVGYAPRPYLFDDQIGEFIPKGGFIPNTNTQVYTDNYSIHISKLRNDFDTLMKLLQNG